MCVCVCASELPRDTPIRGSSRPLHSEHYSYGERESKTSGAGRMERELYVKLLTWVSALVRFSPLFRNLFRALFQGGREGPSERGKRKTRRIEERINTHTQTDTHTQQTRMQTPGARSPLTKSGETETDMLPTGKMKRAGEAATRPLRRRCTGG